MPILFTLFSPVSHYLYFTYFVPIIFQPFFPLLVFTASSEQEEIPDGEVKLLGQVMAW